MDVKANATRVINDRGNQVLIVTGQVDSNSAQAVLPTGDNYEGKFLEISVKGGSAFFSFQVEAAESVEKVEQPKLLSEMTREEQNEVFLKSQLNDPNLDDASKAAIREKLGISAIVSDVRNARVFADALGLPDLKIPGKDEEKMKANDASSV